MSTPVTFTNYGFFEDQWALNQTNWASYFAPTIPDGVISGIGDELQVYASSSGMFVYVRSGECRVRSHRGESTDLQTLSIDAADATYNRIDLVVARVNYATPVMELAVKNGTPAQEPVAPELVQNAGDIWEIPLAEVTVTAGALTISNDNVKDRRYVYKSGGVAATDFSDTTLVVANDWEYRNNNEIESLNIVLPDSPSNTFMCSVCFTSSASFTGVTFSRGGESYAIKTIDGLNFKSVRYNLIIWWDGAYFWCGARAV